MTFSSPVLQGWCLAANRRCRKGEERTTLSLLASHHKLKSHRACVRAQLPILQPTSRFNSAVLSAALLGGRRTSCLCLRLRAFSPDDAMGRHPMGRMMQPAPRKGTELSRCSGRTTTAGTIHHRSSIGATGYRYLAGSKYTFTPGW